MRIHKISFQNINSLTGGWCIDFDHPAYTSEGIFSITGPTGAGKTSILDALCLALYGQTPRLGKITQSANEVMSRHTNSCMAEVTFSTKAGLFRCHFSQGKTKNGDLKQPRREIVDAATGEILESKLTSVATRVVAETGMEFGQFTRSMLLAQGGFAAFLQASGDERSKILEKITGTGIYTTISRTVHERFRKLKEKKERLKDEIATVVVLSDEDLALKEKALQAEREKGEHLKTELSSVLQGIAWRTTLAGLEKEYAEIAREQDELDREVRAFSPMKERLAVALAAQSLVAQWSDLMLRRNQEKKETAELVLGREQLPKLAKSLEEAEKSLAVVQEQLLAAKKTCDDLAPLLTEVRALDTRISEREKALDDVSARLKKAKDSVDRKTKELAALDAEIAGVRTEEEALARERETRAGDARIEGAIAGIREQMIALGRAANECAQRDRECVQAKGQRNRARKTMEARKKACDAAGKKVEEAELALDRVQKDLREVLGERLLREYRDEKEHLLRESIYLHTIQNLEDERARLVAGKPCPLCGSCEHPYATHAVPKPDAVEARIAQVGEVIKKAENLEAQEKKAQDGLSRVRTELTTAEKAALEARCAHEADEQALLALEAERARIWEEHGKIMLKAAESLAPFGISLEKESDPVRLLSERSEGWKRLGERATALETRKAELSAKRGECDAVLAHGREALALVSREHDGQKASFEADRANRAKLFGTRDPDVCEAEAKNKVVLTERREAALRKELEERRLGEARARADCESRAARLKVLRDELGQKETSFACARRAAGFEDEASYEAAILPQEERESLAKKEEALKKRSYTLAATRAEREKRLAEEKEKNVTPMPLEELTEEKRRLEEAGTVCQENLARLAHEIASNAEAKKRLAEKESERAALDKEYAVWGRLHEMIGSSDGKKYCAFAQGLTFDALIAQANAQLRHMSDRYRLVRDRDEPMMLNVIDRYQADTVRSIKNLSGGESFLVSLSLALGLSNLASNSVRVESLFLDEGFGTLDESALDMALQTLANLREDGTLICVISHIQALQDRIGTQIRVDAKSGGVSTLTGPGISRF